MSMENKKEAMPHVEMVTPLYGEVKKRFIEAWESRKGKNQDPQENEKLLVLLEALADAIENNTANNTDFQKKILIDIQLRNKELYEAYNATLKKLSE